MKNKKTCESSPYSSSEHQRLSTLQYQVMRELNLVVWDSSNVDAVRRFYELQGKQLPAPTGRGSRFLNWRGHHGT